MNDIIYGDDDFDDPYDNPDLAEDTEPKVWLMTIYPDDDWPWSAQTDADLKNAILSVLEIKQVELKRMDT